MSRLCISHNILLHKIQLVKHIQLSIIKLPSILQLLSLKQFTRRVQRTYWKTLLNNKRDRNRYGKRTIHYISCHFLGLWYIPTCAWKLGLGTKFFLCDIYLTLLSWGVISKIDKVLTLLSADSTESWAEAAAVEGKLKKLDSWQAAKSPFLFPICHTPHPDTEILTHHLLGQTECFVWIFQKKTQNLVISPSCWCVARENFSYLGRCWIWPWPEDLKIQGHGMEGLWEHQAIPCYGWGSAAQWQPPEPYIPQSLPNLRFYSRFSSLP